MKLTYEEWLEKNPATFKKEDAAAMMAFHGVDMQTEIDQLLRAEYEQYLNGEEQ